MRNRSLVPRPWWQVCLAVLPGSIFLLRQVSPSSIPWGTGLRFLLLVVMILLTLTSVLLAAVRRSLFRVPVWGLVPLGWLAGSGLIWPMDTLGFYPTCCLLAVTGLLFAKHNGLGASLFILAGGIVAATWAVEPTMYFWDSPSWRTFVNAGMTVLFTILTPILVLRLRSILGQTVALLFPIAVYSAALVFALSSVRGMGVSWAVSAVVPFIALFVTIAIAGPVYAWIPCR